MRIPVPALLLFALSAPASAGSLDLRIVDQAGKPVPDAVVTVYPAGGVPRGGFSFTPGPVMTQENIAFVPHVLIVPVGATVRFPNHDKVRHHVYSFSKPARFEIKLFGKDETRSYTFTTAGTVALGCNIHDQMSGFIKVVDTPFAAKTNAAGQASISGLALGTAQVTVWHPSLRAKDNEQKSVVPIPASGAVARTVTLILPALR
ncbi:methylamine utilization protein [Sphingomonas sp. BIUV-7]|uniref:Methylamine utilization protein n=1 Tax=Sphingomonas natans TaxID=3063330 RepID=A0ABT8YBU8_9SPHN|nr:methylamine utilization protein [Sphingomonas sp. BIUV-7]MDO6415818.1 methylamine utilization protein [Sphingomonas sp. BIUV-7]